MEMNSPTENVTVARTDGADRSGDRSRGRLRLPCRRRVEDLWTLVTAPDRSSPELVAHTATCRYCGPQLARLEALVEATVAMREAPMQSPDGFLDRVMSAVAGEMRGGPDLQLLPDPSRATISSAAVLAVVRRALATLVDLGDEFRLRRSKVSGSAGFGVDLVLTVELAHDCDEAGWRALVISTVTLAVGAEIGLPVIDVDLTVDLVRRRDDPAQQGIT